MNSKRPRVDLILLDKFLSLYSSVTAGIRGSLFRLALARLNFRVNNLLFASIMKQEIGFFDTNRTGMPVSFSHQHIGVANQKRVAVVSQVLVNIQRKLKRSFIGSRNPRQCSLSLQFSKRVTHTLLKSISLFH